MNRPSLKTGTAHRFTHGGSTTFYDTSTAGSASITNRAGSASSGAGGGNVIFSDNGSLQGFSASDFTLSGAALGDFAFANGALPLNVTGIVPEPGVAWLLLAAGGVFLWTRINHRRLASSAAAERRPAE